jgi:protein TonB
MSAIAIYRQLTNAALPFCAILLSFQIMRLRLPKRVWCFAVAATVLCGWAHTLAQTIGGNEGIEFSSDFEVKIEHGECQVREKESRDWRQCSKVNEPVAIGLIDGRQKIYVATKAVKPPKPVHQTMPNYPDSKRSSGENGRVTLYVVVDDQGTVRLAKVHATSGPEFSKEAVEAVTRWTFKPARLEGEPVAVLISIVTDFIVPSRK